MQHHDAGIRSVGEDAIRLVDLNDGNAAGRDHHLLPRTLKALAIIDIAVGAGAMVVLTNFWSVILTLWNKISVST